MIYRDTNLSPGSAAAPVKFQISIVGFLYRSRQAGARYWTDSPFTGTERPVHATGWLSVPTDVSLVVLSNFIILTSKVQKR